MKNLLAITMLLASSTQAAVIKGRVTGQDNKALAQEYLRQVYAQVGETYHPEHSSAQALAERRRRRSISREEFKNYHNIYPPSEGAVAKLRGVPWPCSEAEPCAEGEGTCFNPHETYEHPDLYCEDGLWCQERKGGSRDGPGEHVPGVHWDGALKMHHMGANDICFDPDWAEGHPVHRAVLRRKLVPCTHDDPCDVGEGDCGNDDANCNEGLHCKFRADVQFGPGEPLHGVEFTGDLLQSDDGDNDLCYNPHWPNVPGTTYEGMVVKSKEKPQLYVVIDGNRHLIPDDETFHGLWPDKSVVVEMPNDAFADMPITGALCHMAPLIKGDKEDAVYLMLQGKKRHILNPETYSRYKFRSDAINTMPQCAVDGIPDGVVIHYVAKDTDAAHGSTN